MLWFLLDFLFFCLFFGGVKYGVKTILENWIKWNKCISRYKITSRCSGEKFGLWAAFRLRFNHWSTKPDRFYWRCLGDSRFWRPLETASSSTWAAHTTAAATVCRLFDRLLHVFLLLHLHHVKPEQESKLLGQQLSEASGYSTSIDRGCRK